MGHIVLGVGGTGQKVLTHLKELLPREALEQVFLLSFDTISPEKIDNFSVGGIQLDYTDGKEYFYLSDEKRILASLRSESLRADEEKMFRGNFHFTDKWFKAALLPDEVLCSEEGAGQHRQVSTARVVLNSTVILAKLQEYLRRITGTPTIWIVGSIVGGTGSGAIIPLSALARLAAPRGMSVNLRAVIVLNEAYSYVRGMNPARGFSLIRELDYLREIARQPFDRLFLQPDPGGAGNEPADSYYEKFEFRNKQLFEKSGLFDSFSYVDRQCDSAEDTSNLLREVANGLRLFVDPSAGGDLGQEIVNNVADMATKGIQLPAPTFGFHEIKIPVADIAKIMALEFAIEFAKQMAPPNQELSALRNERESMGGAAQNWLAGLFLTGNGVVNKCPRLEPPLGREDVNQLRKHIEDSFGSAKYIVDKLFNVKYLGESPFSLGDKGKQALNAFKKELKPEVDTICERIDAKEVDGKIREEDEKKRFQEDLDRWMRNVLGKGDSAAKSVMSGLIHGQQETLLGDLKLMVERQVRDEVARVLGREAGETRTHLKDAIDFTSALERETAAWTTQLARIVNCEMEGVIESLQEQIKSCATVRSEAQQALDEDALQAPRKFMGIGSRDWDDIDRAERKCLQAAIEAVEAKRRMVLVDTFSSTLKIIGDVAQQWRRRLQPVASQLVNPIGAKPGVLNSLQAELDLARQNLVKISQLGSVSIGLTKRDGDETDQQAFEHYVDHLRRGYLQAIEANAVSPEDMLRGMEWVLKASAGGEPGEPRPMLKMKAMPGSQETEWEPALAISHTRGFHEESLDSYLSKKSIWDYLRFMNEEYGRTYEEVGRILRRNNKLMLQGRVGSDDPKVKVKLLYNGIKLGEEIEQVTAEIRGGIQSSQAAVGQESGLKSVDKEDLSEISTYPDPWAIGLYQSVAFDADNVVGIDGMRRKYLDEQSTEADDYKWMPRTYHTLRAIQRAFDAECERFQRDKSVIWGKQHLIHPIVARALREPHYAWYFFRLLVVGAIKPNGQEEWIIEDYDEKGDLKLTNQKSDEKLGDLITAMSRFCVQQRAHESRSRPLTVATLQECYQKHLGAKEGLEFGSKEERAHLKGKGGELLRGKLEVWDGERKSGEGSPVISLEREHDSHKAILDSFYQTAEYLLSLRERMVRG